MIKIKDIQDGEVYWTIAGSNSSYLGHGFTDIPTNPYFPHIVSGKWVDHDFGGVIKKVYRVGDFFFCNTDSDSIKYLYKTENEANSGFLEALDTYIVELESNLDNAKTVRGNFVWEKFTF